jgi:hypothetical protein
MHKTKDNWACATTESSEEAIMSNEKRQLKIKGHPENLAQINLHAAGLDIGAFEIYACVPADQAEEPVRAFPTFTPDLYALADWLAVCEIDTVQKE